MGKALRALAFLGSALYWPLLRRGALFYSLAGHDATIGASLAWYSVYLASVLLVVVASQALVPRVDTASPTGHVRADWSRGGLAGLVGLGGVQAALKVVEVLVEPTGAAGLVIAALDTVLYACVFVALTYVWAAWYVAMGSRTAALTAIASFALSLAAKSVMFAPEPAGIVLNACLPLLSLACWCVAGRREVAGAAAGLAESPAATGRAKVAGAGAAGDPGHAAHTGTVAAGSDAGTGRAAPLRLIVVLAAFLVLGGVVRGFVSGYVSGAPLSPAMSMQDALSIAFAVLLFAYTFTRSSSRAALRGIWPAATILFFAGLFLLSGMGWGPSDLGSQIVIIGRTCLDLLLWIVLVDVVREGQLPLVRAFGLVFAAVDALSSLLGYVMVPLVLNAVGASPEGLIPALSGAVAFALIVASVLFFGRELGGDEGAGRGARGGPGAGARGEGAGRGADRAEGSLRVEGAGGRDVTEAQVEAAWGESVPGLAAFGLTEREMAVASLLAGGNSQRKIAELLGISLGTVQSHVKGVYRKLDIHSKQELIDMARGR